MTLSTLLLETDNVAAADLLHKALGVDHLVGARPVTEPGEGFRGFSISLVCSQPANVDLLLAAAVEAGTRVVKPAAKSFWGYGGVVQSPDGIIWKLAASSKKDTAPAAQAYDELVLLLGVADVKASKQFYTEAGLEVAKSFGSRYVELEGAGSPIKLALYGRKALAKDAGVAVEGTGSHRLVIGGELGALTDPDGFVWA